MNNKVLILCILLATMSCKAQLIALPPGTIPIENYNSFANAHDGIPDGTYLKDVNHVLDKYLGIWSGSYDGKEYELQILKSMKSYLGTKTDLLLIHYKITDNTGNVIINTLELPDNSIYVIEGLNFVGDNAEIYKADYQSNQSTCGDSGTLYLEITNSSETQMSLYIIPDEAIYSDDECPIGYIKPPFPDEDETPMTLTKQ